MSSLSLRVLELFDENRLSFDETEKLLQAISSVSIKKLSIHTKPKIENHIHIPPHFSSYMNGYTIDNQI